MDKRLLPEYKVKLKEATDKLHASENSYARTLLGRVSTATSLGEANDIFHDIQSAKESDHITSDEEKALMKLFNYIVVDGNLEPTLPSKTISATEVFRKRIWSTPEITNVMQFRSCVTDMYMLGFLSLQEYIELNNEVDRYIQYTLSNGGM